MTVPASGSRRAVWATTIPRLRADHHRPLPVLGMIALFAARVEGIEIDVGDPAVRFCGGQLHKIGLIQPPAVFVGLMVKTRWQPTDSRRIMFHAGQEPQ
jgi:hypothetical protein